MNICGFTFPTDDISGMIIYMIVNWIVLGLGLAVTMWPGRGGRRDD